MNTIYSSNFVVDQIKHWASTLPNAYLGSDYGFDRESYLQRPMSTPVADEIILKIKKDIPILANANSNELSIYSNDLNYEQKEIYIIVGIKKLRII